MPPKREITVKINGKDCAVPAGTTVAALIERVGVRTRAFAIERNREVVRRPEHATTVLADGDVINIVTFVGGG